MTENERLVSNINTSNFQNLYTPATIQKQQITTNFETYNILHKSENFENLLMLND
jgi:hypothetical protein